MDAQDSLSAGSRNAGNVLPDDAASEPLVKAKSRSVCLEDPQVQPGAGSPCRKLAGCITKEPLAYSPTTRLRANVKIVHETSPNGVEIAIAANEPLHASSRVAGHVDQLCRGTIAEPLRPDGKPVGLDGAIQKFRRENVGIGVTPARRMDRGDEICVLLGSRSNKDVVQLTLFVRIRAERRQAITTGVSSGSPYTRCALENPAIGNSPSSRQPS